MKDSDLGIIIRKNFPWDGKGGVLLSRTAHQAPVPGATRSQRPNRSALLGGSLVVDAQLQQGNDASAAKRSARQVQPPTRRDPIPAAGPKTNQDVQGLTRVS